MKKLTLLTVTALTLLCVGGQTITTHAAGKEMPSFSNGNCTVFTYQLDCSTRNIIDMLNGCLPNVTLPDCNTPGTNVPDVSLPENNLPGTNTPDVNLPDCNTPGNNTPDTNLPDCNMPENGAPDTNLPENNIPESKPDNGGNGSTEETVPGEDMNDEHAFIQEIVDLANEERAKEGLAPLTIDTKVQAAAMVRAEECEEYFSHTRPDGSSFITALKEQNVSYQSAGENIAYGQRTPQEVMKAWMNSSGHRANIMNANYTTIGVGYYENANGTDYWCQLFTR